MRSAMIIATSTMVLAAAGVAHAASVEVKDAVARVTVIPENRSDIKVEFLSTNPRLPLNVRTFAGRTIVNGGLGRKIHACRGTGDNVSVGVRGIGEVAWKDMPQVVIRTPRDVDIDVGEAVWGSVGRSASLKLGNAGCGDWTIANVDGGMRISQAGSGNTRAGSAGETRLRAAGSGNTTVGDIRGGLKVDIAGSGDIVTASIAGPLDVRIAGSGDVKIASGHATTMRVMVAGSGNIDFRGVAETLKATVAGSGDIRAKQVTGEVRKMIMGSGGVTIG